MNLDLVSDEVLLLFFDLYLSFISFLRMLGSNKDSKSSQAVKNDYEMFLKAFQKPTQIYKLLSYRHAVNVSITDRVTSEDRTEGRGLGKVGGLGYATKAK